MLLDLKLFILIFIAVAISNCVSGNNNKYDKDFSLDQDVPLKNDLHGLLTSLGRTIKYCYTRKSDIEVNLGFGLFLAHVNLQSCMDKNKYLPIELRNELQDLLQLNYKLLQYLKGRNSDVSTLQEVNMNMASLFNEISWVESLERFKDAPENEKIFRPGSHLSKSYSDWQDYLNKILDYDRWIPSPELSDNCISSLVDSEITREQTCEISKICHHMLRNGTDFGYGLTHRLLFLIQARSGRGCSIYSPAKDKRIRDEFCGRAYGEAEFNAVHDYDFIDLLLEQIALCTLDGHSEFLHRSWLIRLFQHQSTHGCFGEYPQPQHQGAEHRVLKIEHELVKDVCNGHLTGVAAASLGAAVRFIIEMYYEEKSLK